MNRSGIALTGLVATALLASVGLPGSSVDARRRDGQLEHYRAQAARYEAAYNELLQGLARVDKLNERRRTRGVKARIRQTIDRSRQRAATLLDDGYQRHADVVIVEPVTDARAVYYETAEPMTPADFRALRASVADASFARDRIRLVEAAAEHNWFTVGQVDRQSH